MLILVRVSIMYSNLNSEEIDEMKGKMGQQDEDLSLHQRLQDT
jgi:hypothetical protein